MTTGSGDHRPMMRMPGDRTELGDPPRVPPRPSGAVGAPQGTELVRSAGGVPFGRIPSGGVLVTFLPPGGAPAGGVPLRAMCSRNAPAEDVPFGRTRSSGGPSGVPAPDTAVSEAAPPGDVVGAAPMPESAAGVVVELAVQPAVQAKQPSTAAIARIGRRMRPLSPSVGDSLFMYVL